MSTGLRPSGFRAYADINRSRFAKVGTGNKTVIVATANAITLGITGKTLEDAQGLPSADANIHARATKPVDLAMLGDEALLILGTAGAAYGDYLISDGTGQGVVAASTGTVVQNIGAKAMAVGVAGDYIPVQVLQLAIRPALT